MSKTDKTVDILAEHLARWEKEEHRRKTTLGIRMRQAEKRGVVFNAVAELPLKRKHYNVRP